MHNLMKLLQKNLLLQIKERPMFFFLINLSLSVSLFCTLFLMEFMLQMDAGTGLVMSEMQKEAILIYGILLGLVFGYTTVNIIALYRYMNQENKMRYLVYKMFGCSQKTLFWLTFCEFFAYTCLSSVIGTACFWATQGWRTDIGMHHDPQAFFGVFLYYFVNLIVVLWTAHRACSIRISEREQLS